VNYRYSWIYEQERRAKNREQCNRCMHNQYAVRGNRVNPK